jgi:hypothetical protein
MAWSSWLVPADAQYTVFASFVAPAYHLSRFSLHFDSAPPPFDVMLLVESTSECRRGTQQDSSQSTISHPQLHDPERLPIQVLNNHSTCLFTALESTTIQTDGMLKLHGRVFEIAYSGGGLSIDF